MQVTGPERYGLTFDANTFAARCQKGTSKFSGIANCKKPKLYIVSIDEEPIYVGITKQRIPDRLRYGWSANGRTGYYGYAWRHCHTEANLDIWCHENPPADNSTLDIETVEAEVVFLVRAAGQWPLHQTEIHFHPSKAVHRNLAESIIQRYKTLSARLPSKG